MKIKTLFFLSILFSHNSYSQQLQKRDSLIYWSSDYKLDWSDFRSNDTSLTTKNMHLENIYAYSCLNIKYYNKGDDENPDFIIINYFNRNKSWKLHNSLSRELLIHEQLHFDIDQLYVRKIRKLICELDKNCMVNEEQFIINIKLELNNLKQTQTLYDTETSHGSDLKSQNKWNEKIAIALNKLKYFEKENKPLLDELP